ncbi:MAG TPA: alkaline phosphatase family protein [Caulifigura sp.]|nr:alkaline phosphatase family protein [Caulifigura sp.]
MRRLFTCLAFIVCATATASAADSRHVLVIGIDGCRPDALAAADTPNLDVLIANGTYFEGTDIVSPDRKNPANTVSGPGWSNLLCGVWPDKHGVVDNKFTEPKYDQFPHFFRRLKEVQPAAKTASFSNWKPIHDHITRGGDLVLDFSPPADVKGPAGYETGDVTSTAACVELLGKENPTAIVLYLGQVDENGHAHGFHPSVPQYRGAIEKVDGHIGQAMKAIAARPNAKSENWLVIVCTDHGGTGTDHGGGHKNWDIRRTFLIVSGKDAKKGRIETPTYQVDVVPTALKHLGVEPKPEWGLDGKPVGLEK